MAVPRVICVYRITHSVKRNQRKKNGIGKSSSKFYFTHTPVSLMQNVIFKYFCFRKWSPVGRAFHEEIKKENFFFLLQFSHSSIRFFPFCLVPVFCIVSFLPFNFIL